MSCLVIILVQENVLRHISSTWQFPFLARIRLSVLSWDHRQPRFGDDYAGRRRRLSGRLGRHHGERDEGRRQLRREAPFAATRLGLRAANGLMTPRRARP